MKIIIFAYLVCISLFSISQSNMPKYLDSSEVSIRFNAEALKQYNINYPIYRVYEFTDILGKHELVLTENPISAKETDSIQAFCFLIENDLKTLEWKLTDFILRQENVPDETSIWFWTKYLRLEDLNNDGGIDPIIVYGTKGEYGTEDGRLKILIYFNGKKHGIRHQNSGMDFARNTRVDESFYELNSEVQNYISELMKMIYDSGNTIFPAGWEESMLNKQLYFDEN